MYYTAWNKFIKCGHLKKKKKMFTKLLINNEVDIYFYFLKASP